MYRFRLKTITALLMAMVFLIPVSAFSSFLDEYPLIQEKSAQTITLQLSDPQYSFISSFDSERLTQMNQLIQHFSLSVSLDGQHSVIDVGMDRETILSIASQEDETTVTDMYSMAPDRLFRRKKSRDTEQESLPKYLNEIFIPFNWFADDLYTIINVFPTCFADCVKTEKADINLKGYGKAVRRLIMTVPADTLSASFGSDRLYPKETDITLSMLKKMVFSGNQRFTLLYDGEDHLIRISYDGTAGLSEDNLRNVSLNWKCLRSGEKVRDSLTIKTPAVKGYDRDNLICEREMTDSDPVFHRAYWDIQADRRSAGRKQKSRFTVSLEDTSGKVNADAEYVLKMDGVTRKTKVFADIQKENDDEYSGTLEITEYSGKILKNGIKTRLSIKKDDALGSFPTDSMIVYDPETSEGKTAEDELIDLIYTRLIQKMLTLPEEDLRFLSAGIPPETWSAIIPLFPEEKEP